MAQKVSYKKNPDGTYTRTDPDGSLHIVSGWDLQRVRGIGCLIAGLAVFVLGVVVIVVIASALSHSGGSQ